MSNNVEVKALMKEGVTKEWTLSLTQPHKTGSIRLGLHPLIYNERSLSLVDVGSPTEGMKLERKQ